MLNLPDVTLVLIETREHELARLALDDCLARAKFADLLIFSDKEFELPYGQTINVPDWDNKLGWSRFFWSGVSPYVRTSHTLSIQWDSWIVDPDMWTNDWLKYDFIGAPWWYKDGMNVGNGGFCLRSTKLMRYLRKHRDRFPCTTSLDDDLLCRKYRPALQNEGFVWAPEDEALKFSFEITRPDKTARHFGFHAAYNFNYGCGYDRERLLERARLMVKSKYMTKSNPYFWSGFVKANPELANELEELAKAS